MTNKSFQPFVVVVVVIAIVAGAAFFKIHRQNADLDASGPKTEAFDVELARLRADSTNALLVTCTNKITGLSRIVSSHIDCSSETIRDWRAEVTAEYVNKMGGIERTNMTFTFDKHGWGEGGKMVLSCYREIPNVGK